MIAARDGPAGWSGRSRRVEGSGRVSSAGTRPRSGMTHPLRARATVRDRAAPCRTRGTCRPGRTAGSLAIYHGGVQRTVAILNQKGGVGKTTVTLGLASAAAAAGRRVLVVDMDPQASSSWVLGVDPGDAEVTVADVIEHGARAASAIRPSAWSPSVDVLPSSSTLQEHEVGNAKRLRKALDAVEDHYEAVLVDCPPSLGNLTRSALTASRHAVIVVEPSALGLRGIGGVADLVDDVWDASNPDLELAGVVLNRVPAVSIEADRRIDELTRIVGRQAIWKPPIPQRVVMNQAIGERRPIHSYGSRATEPITAFDSLWRKVRQLVKH
jgi:chromosome partitioning protein